MTKLEKRNKYFFGLGTVGRDMFYAFEANALLYYLSNVLSLPVGVFAAASMVLTVLRILDALNDPITGLIIDNIHSPWGKYKPPMLIGAVTSSVFFLIPVSYTHLFLSQVEIFIKQVQKAREKGEYSDADYDMLTSAYETSII